MLFLLLIALYLMSTGNGQHISDKDECKDGAPCTGNRICSNYPGGFNCSCMNGYTSSENTTDCQDIDECDIFCSSHGQCINFDGGYTCQCDEGYSVNSADVNNITCEDIDECHGTSYFCGGTCNNADGSWTCECEAGYTRSQKTKNSIFCTDIDECVQNRKACIRGFCQNTNGSWNCSCREGAIVKVINETTKECTGRYQYLFTMEFAVLSTTENMDENNPLLEDYFKNQITEVYRTSFPHCVVKVDILTIKNSQRVKRQTSSDLVYWEVDFVLNIDKPVEQKVIESAWSNFTEKCRPSDCQIFREPPSFKFYLGKVVLKTDPASVLCDHYHYCDEETTSCEYVNDTTQCTCKKGYIPKENTDAKCQVIPGVCTTSVCENGATCVQPDGSGSFNCICQKGWTGDYCNIAQTLVYNSDSDKPNAMLIVIGLSLGGVILILLIVLCFACNWRAGKIKKAQRIAMNNRRTNGFTDFDHAARSQRLYSNRTSGNLIGRDQQSGDPMQYLHTKHTANMIVALQNQQQQTTPGLLSGASNGNANQIADEHVYMTIQDSHLPSNISYSNTANSDPLFHIEEGTSRAHPKPDYERFTHPESDVHHYKGVDVRTTGSRMVVGYNGNGGLSKDYITPIYTKKRLMN